MLEVAERQGFEFDAVQLPLNVMDAHFRSFERMVLPELVRRGIAVLGMKSMGGGVILQSGAVTAVECLHYALNLPTSVVITGIDAPEILEQAFESARSFQLLFPDAVSALLARTAPLAACGKFELFKTTSVFDATALNPDWLGGETEQVKQLSPQ